MKKPAKRTIKPRRTAKSKKSEVDSQGFQSSLWAEITVVAVIGLVLSVVLHELFHVLMHIDQVPHIGLFPPHQGAIVEILVWLPQGYDLEGEEIGAYTITLLVLMATVMTIFRMRDSRDRRSAAQILFPGDKKMQKLSPAELLKLTQKAEPGLTTLIPQDQKKKRR